VRFLFIIKKLFLFLKEVIFNTFKNDLIGISAEISFYTAFSLFPIVISIVALLSFFAHNPEFYINITSFIYTTLSPAVAEFMTFNLNNLAKSSLSIGAFFFGVVITMWTSTNVMLSFIKGINRAYNIEETRSILKIIRLSISLIFSISFLLIVSAVIIVYGENFLDWYLKLENPILPNDILFRLNMIRWPFVSILLFSLSSLLYFRAPNIKQKFIEVIPGAIFFSIAWSVFTSLFGIYLSQFSTYDATYGTLAIMIILLLWFYITALIFLIGAEINATLYPKQISDIRLTLIRFMKEIMRIK